MNLPSHSNETPGRPRSACPAGALTWLRAAALALLVSVSLGGAPAAVAQDGARSAGEAAEQVRASTGGRVLGVRARRDGGRTDYQVKVLTADGVVRVVTVPGRRG